jgi:PRTRC genetic system protein F
MLPLISSAVPASVRAGGAAQFLPALAEGLVRGGLIDPAGIGTLEHVFANDERSIILTGLREWWKPLARQLGLFRWNLEFREGFFDEEYSHAHQADTLKPGHAFVALYSPHDLSCYTLKRAITALEQECPGFGQTTLAVLEDALRLLPETISPNSTLNRAEYIYWYGEADENAVVEEYMAQDNVTPEDRDTWLAQMDIFTRAQFDASIPRWVNSPQSVRSRAAIKRNLHTGWAKNVFDKLDALQAAAQAVPIGLRFSDFSAGWPADFSIGLLWAENDVTRRVHDDFLNQLFEAGEGLEAVAVECVALDAKSLRRFKQRAENTIALACATEALIDLLGEKL